MNTGDEGGCSFPGGKLALSAVGRVAVEAADCGPIAGELNILVGFLIPPEVSAKVMLEDGMVPQIK